MPSDKARGFELLQKILEARYDFETCDEPVKSEALARFETLVDQAIAGTNVSRFGLVEALKFQMHDYRKARKIAEQKKQTL